MYEQAWVWYEEGFYINHMTGQFFSEQDKTYQTEALKDKVYELFMGEKITKETIEKIKILYQGFELGLSK